MDPIVFEKHSLPRVWAPCSVSNKPNYLGVAQGLDRLDLFSECAELKARMTWFVL